MEFRKDSAWSGCNDGQYSSLRLSTKSIQEKSRAQAFKVVWPLVGIPLMN
jgi:hypothetical protein